MILHQERCLEFIQEKGVGKKDSVEGARPIHTCPICAVWSDC